MVWDELESLPYWDFGLAEYPEELKTFDFGESGDWTYVTEAPSLWKATNISGAGTEALKILSTQRLSRHTEKLIPIDTLTIANTMSCNLGCVYCYNYHASGIKGHPANSNIDISVISRSLDHLFDRSEPTAPLTIQFIGGEPLARWDSLSQAIDEALDRAKSEGRKIRFGINTNATLLTIDRVKWLSARPVSLFISYDGPQALHDFNRPTASGKSSFPMVMEGIDIYMAFYTREIKSCRMTLDIKKATFSALLQDAVARGFNDVSIGFDSQALATYPERLGDLISDLKLLQSTCKRLYLDGKLLRFSWFNEVWSQVASGLPKYRPCKAGHGYLATDPEGNLYPCHRYIGNTDSVIGDVAQPYLPEIPVSFVENTHRKDCSHCWARRICGGECYAVLDEIGNTLREKQSLCVFRRAIFRSALELYAQFRVENPDLLRKLSGLKNTEAHQNQ